MIASARAGSVREYLAGPLAIGAPRWGRPSFSARARRGAKAPLQRALGNLRRGRLQRALAATTALSALPLGVEIYFEHFRGSFGDRWMWTPIALSPLLSAAGVAAVGSEHAARTALPAISALYCLDGLVGIYTHVQGVRKRPGGFGEPLYNIVMGPPLLAPGSLTARRRDGAARVRARALGRKSRAGAAWRTAR